MKLKKVSSIILSAAMAVTSAMGAFAAVSPIGSTENSLEAIVTPHNNDGARANTDSAYTFKLASDTSKTFIMLDENEDGEMFVLTKDAYGKRAYSTGANYGELRYTQNEDGTYTVVYDGEERIPYWLNNDFLANGLTYNGTTYALPEEIKSNLVNVDWQFEPFTVYQSGGALDGATVKQQSVTAKISLLSATELGKYKNIIGYSDGIDFQTFTSWGDNSYYGWWLRSQLSGNPKISTFANPATADAADTWESSAGAARAALNGDSVAAVRPCFYLAKDFLLNVKLDVDSMGDKVKENIKGKYSEAQLKTVGYTDKEIKSIFGTEEPDPEPTPSAPTSPIGSTATSLTEMVTPYNNEGARANTDSAYTFKLASDTGKTFIMLDKNEKNQIFVLTKDAYGKRVYSTGAGYGELRHDLNEDGTYTAIYDGEERIPYWLAHDFLTNGNTYNGTTYKLPDEIINNLTDISWQFEPFTVYQSGSALDGATVKQQSMTSKISLLSATELEKYKNIIGYSDGIDFQTFTTWGDNTYYGWWLRSQLSGNPKVSTFANPATVDAVDTWESSAGAARAALNGDCTAAVRPCFYLSEDFALKVKLDVATMGDKVKEYIKENYSEDQLKTVGYSDDEIKSILGTEEPEPEPDPDPEPTPSAPTSPIGSTATSLTEKVTPYNNDGARANTDSAYTFKLESDTGKTFIMLDKNEKNQMFVLTKDAYGKRAYSTGANYGELPYTKNEDGTYTVVYDGEERIPYWLAHDFLTNGLTYEGTTYKLPDEIINNLTDISWQFEPFTVCLPGTATHGATVKQQSVTAKISLLSATELEKYKNIIGYNDGIDFQTFTSWGDNSYYAWWLRSQLSGRYTSETDYVVSAFANPATANAADSWDSSAGAVKSALNGDSIAAVRPCFYLSEDFALKVKLNVATMGTKVKEFIKDTYERADVEAANLGYTEEELNSIFGVQETDIASFGFKDADNNEVTSLAGGLSVKGVYSITNKIGTAVTAMAVTASYDKNTGRLLGVAYTETPVSIAAGQTAEVSSPVIVLPSDVSNVVVKSFIWSGFDTMKPLSDTVRTLAN